jgi:chaperone modulatory protein CbpM
MIGINVLITEVSGLTVPDLQRWINNDWVRPHGPAGAYLFQDIDVARVRLICELRDELRIDEEALPVVLLLLDQLYSMRRQIHDLGDALDRFGLQEVQQALAHRSTRDTGGQDVE